MEDSLPGNNGNGHVQGWIRLALTAAGVAAGLLWGVAEIKSDIRVLDTRVTGKVDALQDRVTDYKESTNRRLDRLERRGR